MATSNVKIDSGKAIPTSSGAFVSWAFETVDFRDLEVYSMDSLPTDNDLKQMMKGKTAMIVVRPIENDGYIDTKIVATSGKREELQKYPCCIKSQSGALMPQIIVPTESGKIVDNGLVSGSDEREVGKIFSKGTGGYSWKPSGLTNAKALEYGSRREEQKFAGYIDMSNARCSADANGIATRKYELVEGATDYSKYKGACAFMYRFSATSGPQEGSESVVPKIFVGANGKSNSKALSCSIASDMDIFARYADDTGQGRISNPSSGFYPPQHQDIGGACMFMYPLYSGVCFAGSATKQLNSEADGTDGAFVAYSELRNPFDSLVIENATKTSEIKSSISENPDSEMMWFPTLVQEHPNPEHVRLRVNRENTKYAITYGGFEIEWIKSLGAFAYSPIFFTKEFKLYFYFKGSYADVDEADTYGENKENSVSTTYYVYPIAVNAGPNNTTISKWTSSGNGASNMDFMDSGNGCPSKTASCKSDGDDSSESIYMAELQFKASDDQTRYPMEVYGCVIGAKTIGSSITPLNQNGVNVFNSFIPGVNGKLSSTKLSIKNNWMDFITNVSVSSGLQGVSGSVEMDMFATGLSISTLGITQYIGEVDLKVTGGNSTTGENIFTGYGMELKQNVTEASHTIGIRLEGVQKKLADMKLVACPFWDGDRLEVICHYFQQYTGLTIKMVDNTVSDITNAKAVSSTTTGSTGTWKSSKQTVVGNSTITSPDFRVPRSIDYRKPAVDFPTGTACLDALNKLAEMTSCVFVVQPDGICYFFELNDMGYPYYVDKQTSSISFNAEDVISLNISPYLENKFNFFVTSGFIMKKDHKTKKVTNQTVTPKFLFTTVTPSGSNFPWSRMAVNVENGYLTVSELANFHANNVKFGLSDMYQGTLTVAGNDKVTHIYQKITVCGTTFFVISIDHNVNLQTKEWTTSYGLNKISF